MGLWPPHYSCGALQKGSTLLAYLLSHCFNSMSSAKSMVIKFGMHFSTPEGTARIFLKGSLGCAANLYCPILCKCPEFFWCLSKLFAKHRPFIFFRLSIGQEVNVHKGQLHVVL